jgi:predicted ATPase
MGFYYSPTAYQELLLKLHNFAQEAKIPVFISLLNLATAERRGGDRRPEIMDFYRSDILCQNAHKIFQLYRPIVYGITEDENGCSTENKLEINLLKNSLGKSGTLGFQINNSGKIEGRF